MKPRVHALRCSGMRDSHAKCVKIYLLTLPPRRISSCFQVKPPVAPTLLNKPKGLGRNQPFDPGNMNLTQAAAAKLCQAPADGGALHCTEPNRRLVVSTLGRVSFRPLIHYRIPIPARVSIEFPHRNRTVRLRLGGSGRRLNPPCCSINTPSATRNFLSHGLKKQLARRRAKVL